MPSPRRRNRGLESRHCAQRLTRTTSTHHPTSTNPPHIAHWPLAASDVSSRIPLDLHCTLRLKVRRIGSIELEPSEEARIRVIP